MFDGGLESLIASAGLPATMRLRLSSMIPGWPQGRLWGTVCAQYVNHSRPEVWTFHSTGGRFQLSVLLTAQELGEVRDVSLVGGWRRR